MAGQIVTKQGTDGPLGTVRSVTGKDGIELLRLVTVMSALRLYAEHGIKVSRNFNMKLVKNTTGLKTNDKQKHMDRLKEMIEETRSHVEYVEE
jgi:hypothetical protein